VFSTIPLKAFQASILDETYDTLEENKDKDRYKWYQQGRDENVFI